MSRLTTTLPMATRSDRCKITYSDCTTWWTAALRQTRSRGELWNIGDCQITLDKRCVTHCVSRGGVDRNKPNADVRTLGQQPNDPPPPPNNQATANAKSRSHGPVQGPVQHKRQCAYAGPTSKQSTKAQGAAAKGATAQGAAAKGAAV